LLQLAGGRRTAVATINLVPFAPDCMQHDVVLAALKAWPIDAGARGTSAATASLDRVCARRPARCAGRDEETLSVEQTN